MCKQFDAHIQEWLKRQYQCKYCTDAAGYCNCMPPLEIVLYDKDNNIISWTGPIGCHYIKDEQND